MTLDLLDPLVARRLNGRPRPGPAWRRWTLQRLRRRRLAALLAEEVAAAKDAGDLALVQVLEGLPAAVEALVAGEPDDEPEPEPPKRRQGRR